MVNFNQFEGQFGNSEGGGGESLSARTISDVLENLPKILQLLKEQGPQLDQFLPGIKIDFGGGGGDEGFDRGGQGLGYGGGDGGGSRGSRNDHDDEYESEFEGNPYNLKEKGGRDVLDAWDDIDVNGDGMASKREIKKYVRDEVQGRLDKQGFATVLDKFNGIKKLSNDRDGREVDLTREDVELFVEKQRTKGRFNRFDDMA